MLVAVLRLLGRGFGRSAEAGGATHSKSWGAKCLHKTNSTSVIPLPCHSTPQAFIYSFFAGSKVQVTKFYLARQSPQMPWSAGHASALGLINMSFTICVWWGPHGSCLQLPWEPHKSPARTGRAALYLEMAAQAPGLEESLFINLEAGEGGEGAISSNWNMSTSGVQLT